MDVLCFGGTKNGLAVGEAVVFFNRELAREFDYRCKQGGQLASKMRFLSAPWVGMLQDGAWLRHAKHSNAMAKRLEAAIRPLPNVQISYPVESNAVFAKIPEPVVDQMHERGWKFYTHVGGWEDSRLMCSWDTTPEDVDGFAADLKELVGGAKTGAKLERPARALDQTATDLDAHRPSLSHSKSGLDKLRKLSLAFLQKYFAFFEDTDTKNTGSVFGSALIFLLGVRFRLGASIPHDQVRGVVVRSCRNERVWIFCSSCWQRQASGIALCVGTSHA